jgi:hypothetical protein
MKKLMSVNETSNKIRQGCRLVLAGDEQLLRELPQGMWIGGTIPYFMCEHGGIHTKDFIYVDEIPEFATDCLIKSYDGQTLPRIASDEYQNGFTLLILPAFSSIHERFAEDSHRYEGIFNRPLVGWIAGIDLADSGKRIPQVFNGMSGEELADAGAAMHVRLPNEVSVNVDVINLFRPGGGKKITFPATGFSASDCFIDGIPGNFSKYLVDAQVDTRLPLVADFHGALANTAIRNVDAPSRSVSFFAPVFKDVVYEMAAPIGDYVGEFTGRACQIESPPIFSCNCILNYLYSELEGKKTGDLTGPMTFGEIAYQLLNQTLVFLEIESV